MRLFSPKPILWWAVLSGCLGLALSFVPWGSSSGFHGTGFPVFVVAWDRSPTTGRLIDFPNVFGYVLNPLLVFVAGFLLWFVCWLVYALLRRTRTA